MDNKNYDTELRKLGYVDSGYSGSRGDYFILSYRPGARKKHKLPEGLVEVHTWEKYFQVRTPRGDFYNLKSAIESLQKH